MYAYAHYSQPISEINLSPYEIVFHTIPRIPVNFELNLQRDTYRHCTSQFCQNVPLHTHCDKSNLKPLDIGTFVIKFFYMFIFQMN